MVSRRTCDYCTLLQVFQGSILYDSILLINFFLSLPFASVPLHQAQQPRARPKSKVLCRPRAPKANAHLGAVDAIVESVKDPRMTPIASLLY